MPTDDKYLPNCKSYLANSAALWQRGVCALALMLIRAYQLLLSPLLGNNCRFYPSCSEYAYSVIQSHGLMHGSWLALKRIVRCQPLCAGGVDLPPEADNRPIKQ